MANNDKFHELFEALITEMTDPARHSIPKIEQLLIDISTLLRLSKGVTRVYLNSTDEHLDRGEVLSCFDLGIEGELVRHMRIVSSIMTIVTMDVYKNPDTPPLTDEELSRIDLVMRTTISYISRNRMRDTVEMLALYDDFGYPNLRSLRNYIEKHTGIGGLDGRVAVHYNLRHFSLVNQEVGRLAGDRAMKSHFEKLTSIIGELGRSFRLGGDNFVAVFERKYLEDVLSFLNEAAVEYNDSGSKVNISSSAGVFIVPDNYCIVDEGSVMEKIISSSMIAQSGGKEHIVFYDDSILVGKEKSMRVQQLFPNALRNEEFKVFYQPKVNTATGELCGAEALCRWFRNGKIVPPCDFIPMLEETNDICRLDLYMLEHVCQDIRRWLEQGREVVRISVNLSRKHMMNADLVRTINEIIDKSGIAHKYIEIELTETTTDVEFNDLKRVVSGLQNSGIYTSVDDFGIGYSSLNLIRAMPWDVLKVDRSFLPLENDETNSTRSVMFRHVVAMARELGLECVAEGVETLTQLRVLRENYCSLAQGYLFDKPLPVEEFEKRLDSPVYPTE